MKENKDYELIPADMPENDQAWDIRILTGEFNETIIRFGNVSADGKNGNIRFNFFVIYAPSEYINEDNKELQIVAGEILTDVIEHAIATDSLIMDENGS